MSLPRCEEVDYKHSVIGCYLPKGHSAGHRSIIEMPNGYLLTRWRDGSDSSQLIRCSDLDEINRLANK